jgi:putative ABC transport system permease protein
LRRRPLATAAIVATLALGIGAQGAVFRVFDAVAVRPLPFADDQRLMRLYVEPKERTGERLSPGVDVLLALQRETRSFASVVGQRYMDLTMRRAEGPDRVTVIGVTAGWTSTLGVTPRLGRAFRPEEERAGMASGVALVAHATWQGLLGGDPGILGRKLELGDRAVTVVGVMPPGFSFPYDAQAWVPLRPELESLGPWGFFIPARLAPGVSLAAANRELAALAARRPDLEGRTLTAVPIREVLLGSGPRLAGLLLGAVGLLVLLVCANLANLFLVRALARRRELALRSALGASRLRLVRQLLVESLLVSLLGAVAGVAVALLAEPLLYGVLPEDVHRLGGLPPLDLRGLAFLLCTSLACGATFGLLPALRGAAEQPARLLGSGARATGGAGRLRGVLVAGEVALALVLLVGGGLLVLDLVRRQRLDLGYESRGLLTLSVSFATESDPAVRIGKVERIQAALATQPEVEQVGATCIFPSAGGNFTAPVLAADDPADAAPRLVNHRLVTPGFLRTLDLPLVAGRLLEAGDQAGAQAVAVVSASLARHRWPGENALGKQLREARAGEPVRWLTVVGVVGDVAEFYELEDTWYLPLAQHVESPRAADMVFVVRSAGRLDGLLPRVQRAVWSVDPQLAVFDVETPSAMYRESLAAQRSTGMLAGAFAVLALLVAVVGVYAAMAAWAAERRRETAIRLAIGATPRRLLLEGAGLGMRLVALGMVAGVAAIAALAGVLTRLVEGIDVSRGWPLAAAAALLAITSLLACLLPAWRTLRRDPLPLLRVE